MSEIIVVKIGGSTLGSHDTALADVVELQRRGLRPIVVHGGGPLISDWLELHNVPTRFENGLRVTDAASLEVVVAVLAGVVNKQIVASLTALGARAIGFSGADGALLQARVFDRSLGLVGEITGMETSPLHAFLEAGFIPVVAPIAIEWEGKQATGQLLNLNADTAAGMLARGLHANRLVFLTDVPGVRDGGESVAESLAPDQAKSLIDSGIIEGGMIPKVRACIAAAGDGCQTTIIDGREQHSLLRANEGHMTGTTIA